MNTLPEILKIIDAKFPNVERWKYEGFVKETYTSMVEEEVERLMEQVVGVKELFPEATLKPDEETALLVQYKEGHNRAIKDQINYWKNKLK